MCLPKTILVLCGLFLSQSAICQTVHHKNSIVRIGIEHGLPNEWIHVIGQDQKGFIWIGTEDGLCRYDGHQFKVFQNEQDDPSTIPFNYITMIQEDTANNSLLIGGLKSITKMEMNTFKFTLLSTPPNHSSSYTNRSFIVDNTGQTWLYREDGYFIMHEQDSFEWVYPASDYSPIKYAGGILHRDTDGLVYLQSKHPHVVLINGKNKLPSDTNTEIMLVNTPKMNHTIDMDTVIINNVLPSANWFLNKKRNQNFFLRGNKLWSFDLNQKTSKLYFDPKEYFFPDSTANLLWWSRLKDQTLFVGTSRGLLAFPHTDMAFQNFGQSNARKIKYYQQSIWISGNNGLFQYSESGKLIRKWSEEKIYSFEFSNDKLFGGTKDGKLILINLKTNKSRLISHHGTNPGIRNIYFTGIRKDKIYFGSTPYLIISDHDLSAIKYVSLKDTNGQLHTDILSGYIREDENELWLGTITGGVFIYTFGDSLILKRQIYKNNDFSKSLTSNSVLHIAPDQDKMYLCMEAGINTVDLNSYTIDAIRKKNGLPDERIMSAMPDGNGNVWISTLAKGLIHWNTTEHVFKKYDVHDGLISNKYLFGSSERDSSGNIYFGSEDGVIRFDPDKITNLKAGNDSLLISDCFINDLPFYTVTGDSIKNIIFKSNLSLKYDQNRIQLYPAKSDFYSRSDIQYKLVPKDKLWRRWRTGEPVLYDGLEPGKYLFLSNVDGKLQTHLGFTISPPWYKSTIATVLFLLSILGSLSYLIFSYIKYRLHLQHLKHQAELVQTKANYFANITHEIKTPLQLIVGPLENIYSKLSGASNHVQLLSWLDTAKQHTQRISLLVQQMETLKKIDEAILTDRIESIDLTLFAESIAHSFEDIAQKLNLNIQLQSTLPETFTILMDHSHFTSIFNNLIQNVLDHSSKAKNILIRLFEAKNQVCIEISDDGEGISSIDQPFIFNRFYTKSLNGKGMGLGLALVQDLIKWHHGTITYYLSNGYSTFLIKFPMNSSLSNEELFEESEMRAEIAVLDNEVAVLEYIKTGLESIYNIHLFYSAQQAIKFIHLRLPNIIITDWIMPGMDGIEFVKKIKQSPLTCHIPIIMISGKSDAESRITAYQSYVDAYLSKPFSMQELKVILSQLLENRKIIANQNLKLTPLDPSIQQDPFIPMLMDFLESNIANADLNVDLICKGIAVSRTQLFRKCIACFGVSVQQLLLTKRLIKAKQSLIQYPNKTITEIAFSCGYKDPNYFSKVFKKELGVNPLEFKQGHK